MLPKHLIMSVAIAVFAAKTNAQSPLASPRRSSVPAIPLADLSLGTQPTPLFLRAIQKPRLTGPDQNAAASIPICGPMPVHRPDTSRLEKMPVVRRAPSNSYSMPRGDLKCFNPLDSAK
jgi:hypothetical protein